MGPLLEYLPDLFPELDERLTALRRSEEVLVDDQVDDETDSEESPVDESQTRP